MPGSLHITNHSMGTAAYQVNIAHAVIHAHLKVDSDAWCTKQLVGIYICLLAAALCYTVLRMAGDDASSMLDALNLDMKAVCAQVGMSTMAETPNCDWLTCARTGSTRLLHHLPPPCCLSHIGRAVALCPDATTIHPTTLKPPLPCRSIHSRIICTLQMLLTSMTVGCPLLPPSCRRLLNLHVR